MIFQILGLDKFTTDKQEAFSIDNIDLTQDELSIFPQDNCIKIYHNGDQYVSTVEDFELNKY